MLYPAMSELLKNVDSRYLLVNVVAHRARQLSIESELTHEPLEEKPVTLAIREVADGQLKATLDDKYRHGASPIAAQALPPAPLFCKQKTSLRRSGGWSGYQSAKRCRNALQGTFCFRFSYRTSMFSGMTSAAMM